MKFLRVQIGIQAVHQSITITKVKQKTELPHHALKISFDVSEKIRYKNRLICSYCGFTQQVGLRTDQTKLSAHYN